MSPAHVSRKAVIASSFIAGVGFMALVGLAAPLVERGALSVHGAEASVREVTPALIEPLNLAAIEAQIAASERTLAAARATTDDDIARLARLTR
ncbi:MAG TPA: hypothetical protein PKY87_15800 [Terricaulis sp.]|jgi:hypothetical protein|nr:hypothetical protein [Terricaulis sp.]